MSTSLLKNVASQRVRVYAYTPADGLPKTGDAANLTAYIAKDYGAVTALTDTSATEEDATNAAGFYWFDISQTETNADNIMVTGKSSTSGVKVLGAPSIIGTRPATGFLAPATAGRTLVVDANGNGAADVIRLLGTAWLAPGTAGTPDVNAKLIGGTAQTGRDLGASVLLAAGQKVDVDTIKTNPVVNGGTITFPTNKTLADTTGAVGSVTGAVGSVTAGVTVTTNNDKTGYGLSAAAVQAIWDALTSAMTTVGSIGKKLADWTILTATAITNAIWDEPTSGHATAGTTGKALTTASSAGDPWATALPGAYGAGTAGKILSDAKTDTAAILVDTGTTLDGRIPAALVGGRMDSSVGAVATDAIAAAGVAAAAANKIADHVLRRTQANAEASSDGDAYSFRSLTGATAKLVNKVSISGTTLTVTKSDDATSLGTQALTTDGSALPIVSADTA